MEYLKAKNKAEGEQQEQQDEKMSDYKKQMPNMSKYANPKMPSMSGGSMKMPKF